MDEILPQSLKHDNEIGTKKQPVGCSTIVVNNKKSRVLGHTEDALTETLNHYYFVVAHITDTKEEKFMSLCYAGHLPGYTMNYNHHGLVFSINTLSAEVLRSGKIPRHFITRALLSAENYDQAVKILRNKGVGAGDGCSINMAFVSSPSKTCYNIEMAPAIGDASESKLDIKDIPEGEYSCHANKYERIVIEQDNEIMLDSSVARMNTFAQYDPPASKEDVLHMLGDCSGGEHCVFRENGNEDQAVKTIALGLFDLNAKTFTLYSDNPRQHEPQVIIPLVLKM